MMIAISRRAKIFILFGLAILISAPVVLWIYKPWSSTNHEKPAINNDTKKLNEDKAFKILNLAGIKNNMKSQYQDGSDYKLYENDFKIKDKALINTFEDLNQELYLRQICVVGIKLLRNYLLDPKKTDYLKATNNILDHVLKKTNSIKAGKTFATDDEWKLYIVDIPHLMAMYDLIAEDDSSNSTRLTQCYEYITKVINSNMEPIYPSPTPSKTDFIKIGTPYLLTNYKRSLKDETCKKLYEEAKKNKNLMLLNKYLLNDTSEEVKNKYGVLHEDRGTMLEIKKNELSKCKKLMTDATLTYKDLYVAVYEILDVPGNLHRSSEILSLEVVLATSDKLHT
ncbi:GSCOCT00014147001.2-RA-CDS [Cotesia congregata]|uniref:Cc_odve66_22 n=1 Tax=Cotesia congregata TaxID=51543 RepID=A0A8J2EL52_COTCN|nr:GSCOCT00014147001.2-RA-CDS [Cotesia congregata]CAG5077175.1 Cc_odve66_22 [Cotesia congregata]